MDTILKLGIIAGALSLSIGLGLVLEKILMSGIFKLVGQSASWSRPSAAIRHR